MCSSHLASASTSFVETFWEAQFFIIIRRVWAAAAAADGGGGDSGFRCIRNGVRVLNSTILQSSDVNVVAVV